ncbi:MAG: chloride channel protein, partial [Gammaproteobacteria bacterium]
MHNPLQGYLSVRDWKTRLVFWSGALAVGGAAAVFAEASTWMMGWHARVMNDSPYWAFLITPAALTIVVFLTRRVFPGSQGSGIPQAIAALRTDDDKLRNKVLSLRIAVGKVLMTLLGFLGGASIGREGPTIHIGASIMYSLGRFTRFPRHYVRHGLIMAGGAAGIAAAFNTPIAGIIFAIEEMARFYEERATGMILIAVIISGITALGFLGNYSYFGESSAHFDQLRDWIAVPMCGVLGGLLGGVFSRVLVAGMGHLRPLFKERGLMIAGLCGLLVAGLGLLSHGNTYGTGYDQARHVLLGER